MRRALIVCVLAALTACGTADGSESGGPGDPAVYDEIAATTDCAELQAGFDRNMDDAERREPGDDMRDVVLSYAEAYNEQMSDSGCYD